MHKLGTHECGGNSFFPCLMGRMDRGISFNLNIAFYLVWISKQGLCNITRYCIISFNVRLIFIIEGTEVALL